MGPNSDNITISFLTADINEIYRLPFCTRADNCFITLNETALTDVFNNPLPAVPAMMEH